MGLGEQQHPGDAARRREDVPLPGAEGALGEIVLYGVVPRGERGAVGVACGYTA
jgi:hypothetical protein